MNQMKGGRFRVNEGLVVISRGVTKSGVNINPLWLNDSDGIAHIRRLETAGKKGGFMNCLNDFFAD